MSMNYSQARRYRKRGSPLSALLAKNPVLVLGLDLPFVIACATSLKTAVAISIEMFIIHLVTMFAAMITTRALPRWSRVMVNVAVSTVTMTLARYLITNIFPDLSNYVGMYIYLLAVNGMTIYNTTNLPTRAKPWPVMASAFMDALAFSLTMVVVAIPREIFGNGSIWGVPLNLPVRLYGLQIVFGGFIITAFMLAFVKFINKKLLAFSISEAARQDSRYTELN